MILLFNAIAGDSYTVILGNWINSGSLKVSWALRFDMLSAMMLFVVMLVSTLVHIYSIGYMSMILIKQDSFLIYLCLLLRC